MEVVLLAGYQRFFDIEKAGRGKGAVGITVTNAGKDYVVLLTYDGYSEVSYNGTVDVPKYSFFSEKGYKLTKSYTTARTFLGLGNYAAYKDFGEESIGKLDMEVKKLHGHALTSKDKATQEEIDKQFFLDLKEFSEQIKRLCFCKFKY